MYEKRDPNDADLLNSKGTDVNKTMLLFTN
jgi:hypothetical protein